MQQLTEGQANAEVPVNENFATLAHQAVYGQDPTTSSFLSWGYYGGRWGGVSIAAGSLTLIDNSTNYIVVELATSLITISTATTNWDDSVTYARVYKVVTTGGAVSSFEDHRAGPNGVHGGGGVGGSFTGGTLTSAINEAPLITLASAGTVNIGAAAANSLTISGTTTITAFDAIASGAKRLLRFAAALTLTHNSTSLILPTGANIVTAAGDVAEFLSQGSGNWRCVSYLRANGLPVAGSSFTGGTLTSALNEAPPATIASGSTVNIGAASANTVIVSGTTTITAFDTIAAGAKRTVRFAGALTLTHNSTSLILPTGANVTTAAGDVAEFESEGSGNWRCLAYTRANGAPLLPFTGGTLASALNEAAPVSIASSASPAIGAAAANTINITGTTTITSFDSIAAGAVRRLIFAGILTLTHNGTSLVLPGASNITTAAGDVAEFVSLGSGNWKCTLLTRASGASFTGGTLTSALNEAPGLTIASGSTVAIGAAAANSITISGTTTINAFDSIPSGARRCVTFGGILTLTNNATSLILPGGSNIVTAAGDSAEFLSLGSGNWRCLQYTKADGTATVSGGALTYFTEVLNTSSPNGTTNVASLSVSSGTTDADFAIVPKGTVGSILAAVPDSTFSGGNKRGGRAVDLQLLRGSATMVASGNNSTISGGYNNTASGAQSTVPGGQSNIASSDQSFASGDTCTASGSAAVAMGRSTLASAIGAVALGVQATAAGAYAFSIGFQTYAGGQSSVAAGDKNYAGGDYSACFGSSSSDRNMKGAMAYASGAFGAGGSSQIRAAVLRVATTNATPTVLTSNGSSATTTNQLVLEDGSAFLVSGLVIARQNSTGDSASWEFKAHVKRGGGGASTTSMVATCTPSLISADSGASAWTIAVTADTGNGALAITVTGDASKSIKWVASLHSTEVVG